MTAWVICFATGLFVGAVIAMGHMRLQVRNLSDALQAAKSADPIIPRREGVILDLYPGQVLQVKNYGKIRAHTGAKIEVFERL